MLSIFLTLSSVVHAAPVQVLIEVDDTGLRLVEAVHQEGPTPLRGGTHAPQLGTVHAVDSEGEILASAPVEDPRFRSIIYAEGGGASVQLERAWARVELEWPAGALRVQLNRAQLTPRRPASSLAESELIQVNSSGDPAERLNMVFLGDGYTVDELDIFASDVNRIADYMFSEIEPYGTYEAAFNIWRIDRASTESGGSHYEVEPHIQRETAYGCFYGCAGIDRLICCSDGDVVSEVTTLIPEADGIMVLVNDPTYGGSGGFTYATSYTEGETGEMVASHELGHSLIGLWDEYDYGYSAGGNGGPNCSPESDGSDWEAWLDVDTVDAFPTCSYRDLYRPTNHSCMMNALQGSYCPVCREETVRVIYDHLPSLVDEMSEPEGPLALEGTALTLTVTPIFPEIESLAWEWSLDGQWLGGGPELEIEACGASGELTLELRDDTDYVRHDPEQLLVETLSWSLERPECMPSEDESDRDEGPRSEASPASGLSSCSCNLIGPGQLGGLIIPWVGWRRRSRASSS